MNGSALSVAGQAWGKLDKESHRLAGLASLAMGAVYQSNRTDVTFLQAINGRRIRKCAYVMV